MKGCKRAFLLFLLLFSLVNANPLPGFFESFSYGILIVTSLLIFAYFVSILFALPNLQGRVKAEIPQLIFSLVLGIFIIVFAHAMNYGVAFFINVPNNFDCNVSGCTENIIEDHGLHDLAKCRLSCFSRDLKKSYEEIGALSYRIGRLGAIYFSSRPFFPTSWRAMLSTIFTHSPGSGFFGTTYASIVGMMDFLATSYFYISVLIMSIDLFEQIIPTILAFAILFRIFPFFRMPASTLISFCLGLLFFLPFSVLLFFNVYDSYNAQLPSSEYTHIKEGVQNVNLPLVFKQLGVIFNIVCNKWVSFIMSLGSVIMLIITCTIVCLPAGLGFPACFVGCVYADPALSSGAGGIGWNVIMDSITKGKGVYSLILTVFEYIFAIYKRFFLTDSVYMGIQESLIDNLRDFIFPGVLRFGIAIGLLTLFVSIITISAVRSLSSIIGGGMQFYGLQKIL